MFHPGLSKCRFFHPSSAVSPCVVGPTWSFHQHIQAHQWCKGIRRAIVVDNALVHNERSAFRYSFIGYESAFAFRPDSSRAGCGPSLLHPLSGAGHERNCPTRILRGLRVRSLKGRRISVGTQLILGRQRILKLVEMFLVDNLDHKLAFQADELRRAGIRHHGNQHLRRRAGHRAVVL